MSVQALLRCLFKNNFPFLYNSSSIPSFPRIQTCPSIFEVFQQIYFWDKSLKMNIYEWYVVEPGYQLRQVQPP